MPCKDITEQIRIILDLEDNLVSYDFLKKTCGKEIGNQVHIMDNLLNKNIDYILAFDISSFAQNGGSEGAVEKFMRLKHLFALQSALSVYKGMEPGSHDDVCAIAEISSNGEQTTIDADIRRDIIEGKIKACGFCGPADRAGRTIKH